jgi:hypothetical protein
MMRNLFTTICVLCSINLLAQKTAANYYSDYFEKDYEIAISTEKNSTSTISNIYIYVEGKNYKLVTLDYKDPELLLSSLIEVRNKYAEWVKIAEDNNITEMTKQIPVDMPRVTVCWYGTEWYFAFNKRINFDFHILDNGKKIIYMMDKVTASSNEYIDETFYWVFQSVEELDKFIINGLDYPKFIEKINAKVNNANLFQ